MNNKYIEKFIVEKTLLTNKNHLNDISWELFDELYDIPQIKDFKISNGKTYKYRITPIFFDGSIGNSLESNCVEVNNNNQNNQYLIND